MTVLMQQGGQLKAMFGGIGNAATALGGYVLGLISPFTVLAAGVGTLGFAAYQGSKEAHELAKSLIMTGNAAGTSVDQLKNMASAVSEATGATKGAAVDALTQIASSGKVAASNMTLVAEAAIAMQKATGAAVEDTVKQFSELGKSPVEASLKLNEQYNYLTASVYRQIKALEDQGRQTEAVTLAQETYAKSVKEQANQIRQDLGGLESAWKSVGNFAKSAWDKMLNVGREGSISDQIATLKKQLTTGSFDFALTEGDIKSQIASLEKKLASETQVTAEKAKQSELDRYGIEWAKEGDKYLSKKQQMEQEITKARNQGIAAGASELEITKRIAAIREKFTEKTSRSGKSQIEKDADALKVLLDKLHGTEDNAFSSDYVTNVEKLIKGWSAGTLKIEQFRVEMGRLVAMQPGVKALAKETEELAKTRDKYAQGISKETESLIKKAEAAEYENAKIGMTADQLEYLTRARYADEIATKQNEAAMIESIWGRNWEVEAIEKQIDALRRLQGAEVARPKLQAQAKEWEKFSDDINRALTDALMRGFEDGKSFGQNFVDSLKNSLKTAALKIVVNTVTSTGGSLVNSAINAVAGTSSENGGSGTNYFGLASNANSAYNLYGAGSQFFTGASTGATGYSLAYANGVNAVGGDGIGALYTANGGWAGVDAGAGAATGSSAASSAWATMLEGGWVALIPIIGKALFGSTERYLDTTIQGTLGSGGFSGQFGDTYKTTGNIFGAVGRQTDWYPVTDSSADIAGSTAFTNKSVVQGLMAPSEYGGYSAEVQTMLDESLSSQLASITEQSAAFKKAFESIYDFSKTSLQNIAGVFEDSTLADKIKDYAVAVDLQFSGSVDKVFADFGEKVMIGMGGAWLPSVEALRASGETWSQALGRILIETQAVSRVFELMGKTLVGTFGENNADSILKASDNLVALFGGTEKFTQSFADYYANFYTDAEKSERAMAGLKKQFEAVNIVMPATRAEFRAMVDDAKLNTYDGQATYHALLGLQGAFAQLVPSAEDVAAAIKAAADNAKGLKKSLMESLIESDPLAALTSGFAAISKAVPKTNQEFYDLVKAIDPATLAGQGLLTTLEGLLPAFNSVQGSVDVIANAQAGIFGQIFDAQLSGMTKEGQIAAMKAKETGLWSALNAGDVSLAEELSTTILQRIALEAEANTAQVTAATAQLDTMKRLRDFAVDMHNTALSLKAGDLSPLSYIDQLNAAQQQWQETLTLAKGGDQQAQGSLSSVGQNYLQEAKSYYGANSDYAATFSSVTGSLDQFSSSSPTEIQIDNQTALITQMTTTASNSAEQVAQLRRIADALGVQQDTMDGQGQQATSGTVALIARLEALLDRVDAIEATNRVAATA